MYNADTWTQVERLGGTTAVEQIHEWTSGDRLSSLDATVLCQGLSLDFARTKAGDARVNGIGRRYVNTFTEGRGERKEVAEARSAFWPGTKVRPCREGQVGTPRRGNERRGT